MPGNDAGSSVIELALLTPVLLLMLVGVVDMGRAYYAAIEISSAAAAGALYGSQKPTDVIGMQSAALLDAADLAGMVPVATFGCECSDGSSATPACAVSPRCAVNAVRYVEVTTTMIYVPLFPYPGVPASLLLRGKSRMRAGK